MTSPSCFSFACVLTLQLVMSTPAQSQASSCAWEKRSSFPLKAASGRAVFVAGMDVARTTEGMIIAGHPVLPWPVRDTIVQDSLFGVLSNDTGQVSLIPAPHQGRRPVFPRILAMPGGIEAIWVERSDDDRDFLAEVVPRGQLWYGQWVRGQWRNVERIHEVREASLAPHTGSRLRREGSTTVFDYSIFQPRMQPGPWAGIVRLARRDARWTADTVRLGPTVRHARIASRAGDSVAVLVRVDSVVGYKESEVYIRRVPSVRDWRLASLKSGAVSHSDIQPLSDGRWLLSWQLFDQTMWARYAQTSSDTVVLEPPRKLGSAGGLTVVPHGSDAAIIAWLGNDQLQSILVRPHQMVALPPLAIEPAIVVPTLIPIRPSEYYLISTKLGSGPDDDLATAYLTHLRLAC